MVNLSSFISIPLFCQVTLTKTKKVLDPSTVSSTRELKDNRKKKCKQCFIFVFFLQHHTIAEIVYRKQRREQTQKKLVMKGQPEPNQHYLYFNTKEKQTSTLGIANTGKGDHLQAKMVRHLNKFAAARELSRQTLL